MKTFRVIGKILAESGLGTDQYVSIAGRKIPRSLIRFCIFTFLFVGTILEVVICVHRSADGYATILYPVSVVLTFLSGALIYASLLLKPTQIVELFNYLENAVNSSNSHLQLKWVVECDVSWNVLRFIYRIKNINRIAHHLSDAHCKHQQIAPNVILFGVPSSCSCTFDTHSVPYTLRHHWTPIARYMVYSKWH